MRVVVDVNLTPQWAAYLRLHGHDALPYTAVGRHDDPDEVIVAWARSADYVILTNDRGFGQRLHASGAAAPGVIDTQIPACNPADHGELVLAALGIYEPRLPQHFYVKIVSEATRTKFVALPMAPPAQAQPSPC